MSSISTSDLRRLHYDFYNVERVGAIGLSDGGGPFGFDITTAVVVDYLIRGLRCDAIVETGCFTGDTTVFLARHYRDLRVLSCDISRDHARVASFRTGEFTNCEVRVCDAVDLVEVALERFERPFFYLDAHWLDDWPLSRELSVVSKGAVCIDDFNVGNTRFAFDTYQGVECGPAFLSPVKEKFPTYFVQKINIDYPFPCLQVGRRAGRCYLGGTDSRQVFSGCPYLEERVTPE